MKNDPNFDFYSFHFEVEDKATGPRLNHADALPPLSSVPVQEPPKQIDKAKRRTARRAFSRVGWAFLLLLLIGNVAAAAVALTVQTFAPEWVEQDFYALAAGTLPVYLFGTLFFALPLLRAPARTPEKKRIRLGGFVAFFTVAVTFMMVGNLLGNGVMTGLSDLFLVDFSNAVEQAISIRPWISALFLVVLAPFFEELIFRKLLIDRLLPHGEWGAVLVSALLFGLFHGNFYQFFYAALLGSLLALLYLRTGRWSLCVLLHALFNLICGLIPMILQQYLDMQLLQSVTDPAVLMDYLNENVVPFCLLLAQQLALWGLALAGVIVFFVCRRKYFKPQPLLGELTERKGSVVFGNVGMVLALVFSAAYFALNLFASVVA